MNMLLAAINGPAVGWALFQLLVVVVVAMMFWWLIDWLAKEWTFPDIVVKVCRTLLIFIIFVFAMDAMMSVVGRGFIEWNFR